MAVTSPDDVGPEPVHLFARGQPDAADGEGEGTQEVEECGEG